MTQIIKSNGGGGGGGGGASYSAGDGIDITSNVISVDTDVVQTVSNMVTSLTGADDDHYPTALAVSNAISGGGSGDVSGPNSSTDGDIVLFDGTTGKAIKDSSKKLSDYQEKLTTQTAYTAKGTASKVPQLTTNTLGQVTGVTEVDITYPSQVSDTAYGSGWDGVTNKAPSQNAVYDKFETLGTASTKNTGTSSGNVPVLDSNGKLNTTILPGVALTDTFTVTNKSDLASLSSAEQGDIGIVTSESKTYVLSQDPYSTLANWKELLTPTDSVTSVNSQTGAVTLDADDISDSTTTNKFVTTTEKSEWSGKQDALTLPSTPTQGNLVVWGANNKTIADGGAIPTGVPSGGNNGDVLTNVSGTPTWVAPAGGITNDTTGTTSTLTSIWVGTEQEEQALQSHNATTLYVAF